MADNILKGGEFLIKDVEPTTIFTPEDLDEEQRLMAEATMEFLEQEVLSRLDEIDAQKEGLMVELLNKAGELGLLGISIPEEYGGLGKDFNTATAISDVLGQGHSFTVAVMAHTGIGTLPTLYYGNEDQKKKYLPKLATGEWKAAYCLTEPNAGSDAMNIKTKAVLSEDGSHYLISGTKIFITNAGFADLFTVFAKIDGEKYTAFLVEKSFGNIELGPEEKKMGIKGSSTRAVYFDNTPVPKENILGEIGKGHHIAFNILNIGRFKLGAACVGAAKRALKLAVNYSKERVQFGRPIYQFGAIQHKIAEMSTYLYAVESAVYYVSDLINRMEKSLIESGDINKALIEAAREYAVEAAILKVAGSEMLDYVVDEGVQIYGGYGYIEEYPMARAYRDSRINRIFEGTNEINRLLIPGMLIRRAMKGELDLMTPAQQLMNEIMSISLPEPAEGLLGEEKRAITNMKKATLLLAGAALQKYMQDIENQQEILMSVADMGINAFVAEAALARALKYGEAHPIMYDMARLYVRKALAEVNRAGNEIINAIAEGDEHRILAGALKRWTKIEPVNTFELRRKIAKHIVERGQYSL
ncbi:MAG: acyl-CoA dehydrogenase [Chlorobi bacterium]|nr:acyl-CoA dehydrogenase [Chlorobiota bacterium]